MCGRYSIEIEGGRLQERFLTDNTPVFDGTYNAAPQDRLPVVTRDGSNQLEVAQWGFEPGWAEDGHDGFINARIETASEKTSFKGSWRDRRCLVPATGFYEWSDEAGEKRPYYFRDEEESVFSFAGLWNTNGKGDISYAILTKPANGDVSHVHDRMPVILDESEEGSWILGRLGSDHLLRGRPSLSGRAVSDAVNSPGNDGVSLTSPR